MREEIREHFPHSYCVEGWLLGLYNDDYSISLEPAGQLEISIAPRESLDAIRKIYQSFLHLLHPFLESRDCCLATFGYQPVSRVDQLPLIPKKRYEFMDHYFQTSGSCGRHMMRGTASTQVSIDYCSEEDFRSKYRAACLLMPALKLLDSYASRGVHAGCDDSPQEWQAHVEEHLNQGYICQEYCPPYRTPNVCFIEEPGQFQAYTNISGLFVYKGRLAGVYSRLSDGGIISSQYNEKAVATLLAEPK